MTKYTPAMQQYIDIKKEHSDCILFFRLWDFYEVFFEDAKICNNVLDLVLTSKNKNSPNPIPMAWIPYHSVDKYLKRLIEKWYKVAIAEQVSQPKPGQIVEREVVSIITPWTYIEEGNTEYSFVLWVTKILTKDFGNFHISWGDFSVWEYFTKSFDNLEDLQKFIFRINPKEIVFDIDFDWREELQKNLKNMMNSLISIYDKPYNVEEYILNQTNVQTLSSYWKALDKWRKDAFSLLLNYIKNTQKTNLNNISKISFHGEKDLVLLDDITLKNLEIFSSNYENQEQYSLFGVINNTRTHWWARLLRSILSNPIRDVAELNYRLDNIQYYQDNDSVGDELTLVLSKLLDMQKLVSGILYRKISVINFIRLRQNLNIIFENDIFCDELIRLWFSENNLNDCKEYLDFLNNLIKDEEFNYKINNELNFIQDWYSEDIDNLRKVAYHSDELLLEYQKELVEYFWIQNIRLKYIKNQWYFLEISKKDSEFLEQKLSKIDSQEEKFSLIRRQTLKWVQRYISEYMEKIQVKVLEAREFLIQKEFELLENAKKKLEEIILSIFSLSESISWLDFFSSMSILSKNNKLVRPDIKRDLALKIQWWRHLVIEKFLSEDEQFIDNDLNIWDDESWILHIITWPNMWGKSTFLRQNALIVLMAHCWIFVPAKNVKIWLVDWIFARVWSGDVIAKNQSTFMTEMIEVANILNNATDQSFIIFDELGRGTSTYDWLALTKAILEYISIKMKSKTLIATHYHELIELEKEYWNIKNFSVWVYETEKEVVFMKKIIKWWADKSYWIDVAKLAGISSQILKQAMLNLDGFKIEKKEIKMTSSQNLFWDWNNFIDISDPKFDKIKWILNSIDINNITPLQAMQILEKLKWEI